VNNNGSELKNENENGSTLVQTLRSE